MTPKGGTVTRTWNTYLTHIHTKMYPDMRDEKGFRVMIKTDLGRGRLNETVIREWQTKGLYFKFGMPNGSSVNQEQGQLYGLVTLALVSFFCARGLFLIV